MKNNNVLLPDSAPERSEIRCPARESRLLTGTGPMLGFLLCEFDGYRIPVSEARPEGQLVDVDDKPSMLVQPNSKPDDWTDDLPKNARVIRQWDADREGTGI